MPILTVFKLINRILGFRFIILMSCANFCSLHSKWSILNIVVLIVFKTLRTERSDATITGICHEEKHLGKLRRIGRLLEQLNFQLISLRSFAKR